MSSVADPLIGATLEKVRILEKIGAGGMGSVYLGEHLITRKKVAVKILPEHLSKDPEYIARFRREATTASRLQHPNIVEVYDIGIAAGKYFIVMSWIDGVSFQTVIETMGTVDANDAAKVAISVLHGLHHAHQAGVIHRDIKPDNILVTKENEGKILDFGLAIETEETQKLTAAGTVVGTPLYISPEQARGHQADHRSDLYSMGVTLYQAVTGRVPFSGQNSLSILNKHIHEMPAPPSQVNPRVPPAMNEIILRLMAKRPRDRYATADLARRDIEAFVAGRAISVSKATAIVPAGRATRAWMWAGGLVTFASVVFALLMAGRGGSKDPDPEPTISRTSTPSVDPSAWAADRAVLQALIREADDQFDDHGSYLPMLAEFDRLEGRHPHDGFTPEIHKARTLYEQRIAAVAEEAFSKLKSRFDAAEASGDLFTQRLLLRDFPRGLHDVSAKGRDVKRRIADLDARLPDFALQELQRADALLQQGTFDAAREKIALLERFASIDLQDRVADLRRKLDDREQGAIAAATGRLQAELAALGKRVDDHLAARTTSLAWSAVADFLSSRGAATLEGRILRLDPSGLAAPDRASESEIAHGIEIADRWASEPGSPPRVGTALLLADLLRIEWLQRRAGLGVARLDGATVELADQAGRITGGTSPVFAPEGGAARALDLRRLRPADLFMLASAADFGAGSPASRGFEKSAPLCLAAGSDALHARTADRFIAARRWILRARELGASVPGARAEELDREAPAELERLQREHFFEARRLGSLKKWDEAGRSLDRAEKVIRGAGLWATLREDWAQEWVDLLLAEAQGAIAARNSGRVGEILRQLKARFAEACDPDDLNRIAWTLPYLKPAWSGNFLPDSRATLITSSMWGWDGKGQGVEPPAKVEGGPSLRLDRDQRLVLNEDKTEGVTGMSAKFRLNEQRQVWNYGILFDTTNRGLDQKLIRVTSAGRLEYITIQDRRPTVRESKELPGEVKIGAWNELAFVYVAQKEAGEVIFYFGEKPVFAVQTVLESKQAMGVLAEGDVSLKDLRLRDYRGAR